MLRHLLLSSIALCGMHTLKTARTPPPEANFTEIATELSARAVNLDSELAVGAEEFAALPNQEHFERLANLVATTTAKDPALRTLWRAIALQQGQQTGPDMATADDDL